MLINEALFEKYGVIQESFPMALAHGHFTGTASDERLCMVDKLRFGDSHCHLTSAYRSSTSSVHVPDDTS